jgi:predicted DNA binding CopG/RHH family protein
MEKRRKAISPRKDTQVMIRLTREDREIIEKEARKTGLTTSAYIRFILYQHIPELGERGGER